jgi:hypothetical protein
MEIISELIEPSFHDKLNISNLASIKNETAFHKFIDELEIYLLQLNEDISFRDFVTFTYNKFNNKTFIETSLKLAEFKMPDEVTLKNTFFKVKRLKENYNK